LFWKYGEKMQKKEKSCDLHTHTVHSDGTLTPRELVSEAKRIGLSAIALTDHNTTAGLDEFMRLAAENELEAAAGVEFSTEYDGRELHLIGLFIDPQHYSAVMEFIGDLKERKNQANRELIKKLGALGYEIDYDALIASTPDGYVNRAHIAVDMLRRGYVDTVSEAFDRFLSEKTGYYVSPQKPALFDTIEFIDSIGAVSILAHPLLQLSREELRALLLRDECRKLASIEVLYGKYSEEDRSFSWDLCRELSLLPSGGSDFHGENKPGQMLGTGKGDLLVPYEFYLRLKERAQTLGHK